MTETIKAIEEIVRDVLDDEEIELTPATTAGDVDGWDSLAHVTIMMRIERQFQIRFRVSEVAELRDVGQLVGLIEQARS